MQHDENEMSQEQKDFLNRELLKARAIRESMIEVLKENQAEVLKRCITKLKAAGLTITELELTRDL